MKFISKNKFWILGLMALAIFAFVQKSPRINNTIVVFTGYTASFVSHTMSRLAFARKLGEENKDCKAYDTAVLQDACKTTVFDESIILESTEVDASVY